MGACRRAYFKFKLNGIVTQTHLIRSAIQITFTLTTVSLSCLNSIVIYGQDFLPAFLQVPPSACIVRTHAFHEYAMAEYQAFFAVHLCTVIDL